VNVGRTPERRNPKRGYRSPARKARAEATRAAIAAAARRSFLERGWAGTTVRSVADAAQVSEPTVYTAYGSKAGLAHALVDAVTAEADVDRQAADLDAAEGDPAAQLAAMVAYDRRLFEKGGDVLAVLRDGALAEPGLAAAYRHGRGAADELRRSVLSTWPPETLRPDLALAEAVDTYAALCTIDLYRELTEQRGWSPDRVEQWLQRTLALLLLQDPTAVT
jgi:TetR/AcrR family transcriptional regulator, regulator of cefoperazone and chloramphenicol sensitivity